jgi:glutamine amidotransferase
MVIGVLDYGMGNLRSVLNALERLGAEGRLVGDGEQLAGVDKAVLPGVGAFGDGMRELGERGFDEAIPAYVAAGRPLLGICLGMQLLGTVSHEHGEHPGLGVIPGEVRYIDTDPALRVPHVGWNELTVERPSRLLDGLEEVPMFYFVHSYELHPDDAATVTGTADYGRPVTASVEHENAYGVQFHPEKSQRDGLRVLENFLAL